MVTRLSSQLRQLDGSSGAMPKPYSSRTKLSLCFELWRTRARARCCEISSLRDIILPSLWTSKGDAKLVPALAPKAFPLEATTTNGLLMSPPYSRRSGLILAPSLPGPTQLYGARAFVPSGNIQNAPTPMPLTRSAGDCTRLSGLGKSPSLPAAMQKRGGSASRLYDSTSSA